METTFNAVGRAYIVTGIGPTLLWLVLNFVFFYSSDQPVFERLVWLVTRDRFPIAVSAAVIIGFVGGGLLIGLNGVIIHCFEGAYSFQRRWLCRPWLRRNQREHERLYGRLAGLRRMREEALKHLRTAATAAESAEAARRADAAAIAVDQAHATIERDTPVPRLPTRAELVTPTSLGNAYAVMEEYPYERYGMDSMIFYTRLLGVLPLDYQARLGDQKITCDLLLHMAVVLGVFAVEAAVALGFGLLHGTPEAAAIAALALSAGGSLLLAYLLYQAAVAETRVLGKLVMSAFDLYRRNLLRQYAVEQPASLAAEREVWQRLGAFIRRGDEFYHPPVDATAKVPPPTPAPPAAVR